MRPVLWLFSLVLALLAAWAYAAAAPTIDAAGWSRTFFFFGLGAFGFLSVFLFPDFKGSATAALAIWIPAVVLRVVLLPAAESDDVYRYLWEGKLVAAGSSPYLAPADAEGFEEYRDRYWEGMNHRDKATAYPPLALGLFAGVGAVAYQPIAMKLAFVAADLAALGAVLVLLRRRGLNPAFSGFYALNPVILVAFAGEGHFDSLMVAALAWGLVLVDCGKNALAAGLWGGAAAIKWISLPLLPFVLRQAPVRASAAAFAVLLLPLMPFWHTLPELFGGLAAFGTRGSFNGPVFDLLHRGLDLPRSLAVAAVALSFLACLGWRWHRRSEAPIDAQIRWILGALLVLSPTVHFWYLAWILPFVCLRPSLPWVMLSLSAAVYFRVWANLQDAGAWSLSLWEQWVFWGPCALAFAYEALTCRLGMARRKGGAIREAPFTVDVVIPTLNAESCLPEAIRSARRQCPKPRRIIVVDGGSRDRTCSIALGEGAAVVQGEAGRGQQIQAGLEASEATWTVILHADARLHPEALPRLKRAVEAAPDAIGGAFGQRFSGRGHGLLWVELLNDLRALFTRTAFGDQVQFFHRETALTLGLIPSQPLMEDVEASWRLRGEGSFLFLGCPCRVSHGKWRRGYRLRRLRLVFSLLWRYRRERLKGRDAAARLSSRLYREYYPGASARNAMTTRPGTK